MYWEEPDFRLEGFFRTGHYHWGYEGDYFGFYREANYGPNIDTYNADVPIGFEVTGRRRFEGLKIAFGPELWWGANPAVLAKYRRRVGRFDATAIYQEDLTRQTSLTSSAAVPVPATRKGSLHLATPFSIFNAELGGLWSGQDRVGDFFVILDRTPSGDIVKTDHVYKSDAFGGKLRLTLERGRFRWYGQTARMGLVADGGPTQIVTYTGWGLKDSGLGNQTNVISGFTYNTGNFQFGPNVLWQKPTVGPIPSDVDQFAHPNVFPRNVSVGGDPFAVRSNREMTGTEVVIGYDPTPATWMWAWDNDVREDAKLAGSLSLIHRDMPTTQDAGTGVFLIGNQLIPGSFGGAPPPHDLWEARLRVVSKWSAKTRLIAVLYTGTGESNGINPRVVKRTGLPLRRRSPRGDRAAEDDRLGQGQRLGSVRLPPRLQPDVPAAAHGRCVAHTRRATLVRPAADQGGHARCLSHARSVFEPLQRSERPRGLRVRGAHLPASRDVADTAESRTGAGAVGLGSRSFFTSSRAS
jgi:hypothetical protein